jgi:hypothetical protein
MTRRGAWLHTHLSRVSSHGPQIFALVVILFGLYRSSPTTRRFDLFVQVLASKFGYL